MTPHVQRRPGLDLLRIAAAALVFFQHSYSAAGRDDLIDLGEFRVGRIGTALFFALAGFLAAASARPPYRWFTDRVKSLFPAYWVVTVIAFLMAGISGTRQFDIWQVICQMAGLGFFTHHETMINVVTWFITPLLLMYAGALVARMIEPRWVACCILSVFVAMALLEPDAEPIVECHTVTFFAAFLAGGLRHERQRIALFAGSALAAVTAVTGLQGEFRYTAVALCAFGCSFWVCRRCAPAERFTAIAYEWFLVHGLAIAVVTRISHRWELFLPMGLAASLLAAFMVRSIVSRLRCAVPGLLRRMEHLLSLMIPGSRSPAVTRPAFSVPVCPQQDTHLTAPSAPNRPPAQIE